jgi:hypothetical protein
MRGCALLFNARGDDDAAWGIRSACIDLFLIFAVWLILIGTMLVLQAMSLDFGFHIWPFGEFRNWIEFLPDRLWPCIWQAGLSFAAAFIIALALGFNHTQVIHVRQERAFFAELRTLVAQDRASGAEFPDAMLFRPPSRRQFRRLGDWRTPMHIRYWVRT